MRFVAILASLVIVGVLSAMLMRSSLLTTTDEVPSQVLRDLTTDPTAPTPSTPARPGAPGGGSTPTPAPATPPRSTPLAPVDLARQKVLESEFRAQMSESLVEMVAWEQVPPQKELAAALPGAVTQRLDAQTFAYCLAQGTAGWMCARVSIPGPIIGSSARGSSAKAALSALAATP